MKIFNTTIAAISTPVGGGGIGIIKISGPDSIEIAKKIFILKNNDKSKRKILKFKSHQLYYGYIVEPENKKILDEVLLSVMIAPNSYTRENVVEINAHSGPALLMTILKIVLKQGASLAEPGEFTKRAFLNGRIDLTQAEAIADTINAKSKKTIEIAAQQIKGELKNIVEKIRKNIKECIIKIDGSIEFPEEIEYRKNEIALILQKKVLNKIEKILKISENGKIFKTGLKLVIIGKPNVGKSSILNCIINKDRAIVSDIPGTTRDFITEQINLNGVAIDIQDTAGIHKTKDKIEEMGIKKTLGVIEKADVVLFVLDASKRVEIDDVEIEKKLVGKKVILVINKTDKATQKELQIPAQLKKYPNIQISALYKKNIKGLLEKVEKEIFQKKIKEADIKYILNIRQENLLESTRKNIKEAFKILKDDYFIDLVAFEIKEANRCLEKILGIDFEYESINDIFKKFCVGK